MSRPPLTAAQKPRMAPVGGLPIRVDRRPGEHPGQREIG